jgi:hypothetical protein
MERRKEGKKEAQKMKEDRWKNEDEGRKSGQKDERKEGRRRKDVAYLLLARGVPSSWTSTKHLRPRPNRPAEGVAISVSDLLV